MLYRRRIIPRRLEELWGLSPRQAEALAQEGVVPLHALRGQSPMPTDRPGRAEPLSCRHPPAPAPSIADWVERAEIRRLRIAEINRIEGCTIRSAASAGISPAPTISPAPRRAVVEGIRSEDLTKLTYPGASFDLVLTSETLEHVPDLEAH